MLALDSSPARRSEQQPTSAPHNSSDRPFGMTSNGSENEDAGRSPEGSRAPQGNRALGAGMTLAVSVGLFAYGGLWLDRQLGTKPWFLLLLVVCGIVGGMLHMIRVVAPEMWPFGKLPKQ